MNLVGGGDIYMSFRLSTYWEESLYFVFLWSACERNTQGSIHKCLLDEFFMRFWWLFSIILPIKVISIQGTTEIAGLRKGLNL